jgi:hypothetical protein
MILTAVAWVVVRAVVEAPADADGVCSGGGGGGSPHA